MPNATFTMVRISSTVTRWSRLQSPTQGGGGSVALGVGVAVPVAVGVGVADTVAVFVGAAVGAFVVVLVGV